MKQKFLTRLLLLGLAFLLMGCLCTLSVAATEQTPDAEVTEQTPEQTEEDLGGIFSPQRIEYAITVTVQGMLMIFAVLAILWGVVAIFKVFLHDIPAKRAAKKAALSAAVEQAAAPEVQPREAPVEDDGEIVAAITAAIAAVLAGEEYQEEFASGFRVVSFKRKGGAWNQEK